MAFSPAYASDHTIFFGTLQQGLLKSTDGGQTVQATGLAYAFAMNVLLSPNYHADQTVFVNTYQGIYKSADGGATWSYMFNPARMEQDRAGNIKTTGTWAKLSNSSFSTSAALQTATAQSTVTITFTGSSVRFIGSKGPGEGAAAFTLDGVPQGTVTLTASKAQAQQLLWQTANLPCVPHTLTVTAVTTASGKTGVLFDALDYGRETCPY
jgi:hypothetical protein